MESNIPPTNQTPPSQNTNSIDNQVPMDEFEFKSHQPPSAKNILKMGKYAIFALIAIALIGGGIVGVNMLLSMQSQPTQTAIASPTPSATPIATEIPVAELPAEYQALQQKIEDYERLINNTPETRTRLNIPIINVTVSF